MTFIYKDEGMKFNTRTETIVSHFFPGIETIIDFRTSNSDWLKKN